MSEAATLAEHAIFAAAIVVFVVVVIALFRAAKEWCRMLDPVEDEER